MNGFDELCDPVGGSEAQLGHRLEWAGASLRYSRRMLTIRCAERHRRDVVRRLDKVTDIEPYLARLQELGVSQRSFDGAWDSSHMILDLLFGLRETRSMGNCYDLRELSAATLLETVERFPLHHWFDCQPLATM